MMKPLRKQLHILLLFFICMTSFQLIAGAEEKNKGEMRLKVERIQEKQQQKEQHLVETELEKTIPNLFQEETKEMIIHKQKEENASISELKRQLFTEQIEPNITIYEIKRQLFTPNYTPNKKGEVDDVETNEKSLSLSKKALAGVTGIIATLCGGLYFILRKFTV